jgi:hypothetical protein
MAMPNTGLWRVPLGEKPTNLNTDTIILDHPLKVASTSKVYTVQTTKYSQDIIKQLLEGTHKEEYIHNVYKLPSMEQTEQYLHAAAGHPTKETWLKAIAKGNYNSWPLTDTKDARKCPKRRNTDT